MSRMKFPLPRSPFPRLQLTPEYVTDLEQLTQSLLDQMIAEYEQFVHVHNRAIDRTKWKHLKSRENLHIYRAFGDHSDDQHLVMQEQLLDASSSTSMRVSRMDVKGGNRLVGVGSVVGNLSDLLYASSTHTEDEMQIRTSYVPDECVDWRVLYKLCDAAHDNPFRTHTIKYHVKSTPGATGIGVRPRDFVVLDCTGETTLPSGERVGYSIYHSLDVPGCGSVEGMVRAQISCAYLFRPQSTNSVEVFMRSICEMGGNMNDSLAATSLANGLISIWKMPWGGQNKKLSWMLRQQRRNGGKKPAKTRSSSDRCPLCKKSYTLLRSATKCELCGEQICSSCLIVRKISHVRPVRELVQISTGFCKHCITQASLIDAADIARKEYVPKQSVKRSTGNSSASSNDSGQTPHSYSQDSTGSEGWNSTSSRVDLSSSHVETVDEWEQAQCNPHGTLYSPAAIQVSQHTPVGVDAHQMQLFMQMNQLRIAAEQTYQITKENGRVMHSVHPVD
ncbi:hypothetical protein Poli38472_001958 [Pythium oligandrum]|uniref:FYVE-type domain-containing protein n=1 Tax=Pythium oligandrum TaxID=41045 RepID=A0A8K1CTT1_PYTOL|nr:hypothetical protein Poli38472_001958 [Pythium oligandrum]|eukprot:TMW69802.1 hypothetical protein Poli38472_001958 [Pythium oligandrum]